MKKLIKLDFNNTTRERKTEDSYSELYSHDKNNGSFEFEILNDTLTTEQVTALFKFTESNKIWKTTGTVEGNKVNVTFDTSLITQNETVICYLYFDEEQRTSDTFRFKFKVKVSEIDKMNRYEVKERFINNTVIVDRLDVVTKEELKEALKNVGGVATEGLLTEVKAEELFVKKTDAVDNTNFELVKNRVLALELKTDKDTVYDDREVKERLTTLENKQPVDLSNYATKEELQEVRNSQPTVDTSHLVTRDELESKEYLKAHQDLSEYALKSELYNDTPLKERVTVLESKAIAGGAYDDRKLNRRVFNLEQVVMVNDAEVKRRLTELESKPAVDTSVFVTEEKLTEKGYLTSHQDISNLATKEELVNVVTKEELNNKHYVTEEELNNKAYLTSHQDLSNYALKSEIPQPYNDSTLNERVTALESKAIEGGAYDDTDLRNRVINLENKPNVDLSNFVTNEQLEAKHYLTEHQSLTHLATTSDLEALRNISVSKSELSKKLDTTEYNTFKDIVVTKDELAGKGYLTTQYDDTDVKNRIQVLENRPTTGGTQTQDTGWINLSNKTTSENIIGIRRIGNTVHVRFKNENDDFVIDGQNYFTLEKKISDGFGSVKNNLPIFLSKNNQELGRIIITVSNNSITVESMIDVELSGSRSVYINEFSYITDEPFPTNLI